MSKISDTGCNAVPFNRIIKNRKYYSMHMDCSSLSKIMLKNVHYAIDEACDTLGGLHNVRRIAIEAYQTAEEDQFWLCSVHVEEASPDDMASREGHRDTARSRASR